MIEHIHYKAGFIWFEGVVEDIDDPLMLGRVRVRAIGFHSPNKTDIKTSDLPWAGVIMPVTSASVSGIGRSPTGILCGSWVVGYFRDGEAAQDPVVFGTIVGIPEKKLPGSNGFSDPNEEYPKTSHLNEPDTNRLARNENTSKTVLQSKTENVVTSVPVALASSTWSEPSPPYDATYPKNHVTETESGHVQEFDDTEGAERIHTYHKAGTFEEIHPDGSQVVKIVGDSYTIVLKDNKVYISGSSTKTVDGNESVRISGKLQIHVEGDADIRVDGDSTVDTAGNHFHNIGGMCAIISKGNMVLGAPRIDLNPIGISPSGISRPF